ncbi:TPA: accessory Sec-dependent serine-rich glycoprotein adhesin, partial [Streptococcus suis]
MILKRFNKNFDEIDRKSKVKMHKSGKNWVRTVMSQLHLLRVIRGQGQATVSVPVIENSERLARQRMDYLKAVLASGAAITGTAVTTAFAEEYVVAMEQEAEGNVDTVVNQDYVVIETVSTEIVDETSLSISESHSQSQASSLSISLSLSELDSQSSSISTSESASFSTSESSSMSASESHSSSLSASESASLSLSESDSSEQDKHVSDSQALSEFIASTSVTNSTSQSTTEEDPLSNSTSEASETSSVSSEMTSSLVSAKSSQATPLHTLGLVQGLTLLNSAAVSTAMASSEVVTALLAVSLNSSSSSESETAVMIQERDYTNLDNALTSLNHALSLPEIDASTTTTTRYQRYVTALAAAQAALEEAVALRADTSASQDQLEAMALKAGQAAISLTGRINQIQAAGGKFAIAEGSGTRAVTVGAAGTDVSSSGVINFRRIANEFKDAATFTGAYDSYVKKFEYDYDATTNLMKYRISITPVVAGKVGIGLSVDATSAFGLATVTGGGTLESQSSTLTFPGASPKGRYFILRGVRAGVPLTLEVNVHTNGSGINNLRFKTVNINTTNDSGFNNPHVDSGQDKFWINPSQGKDAATIGNNPQVKALFNAGSTQTIYTKTEDAPVITDNLTDKSTSITGTGTPYSTVTLTFSNGATTTTVVQENGTWTATPPPGAMAASTTVSAVQDTGKVFPAIDDGILNDVLNSQENRISAATVATIRDTTNPTANLTATSLYAFETQALQAPIKIANLADNVNGSGLAGGQSLTQIIMDSSTTENGKGLTINTSGQVSGTPVAGSQGTYTNRVLVRDNAGNTAYSTSFKMHILRVNPATSSRQFLGNNKFSQNDIINLIKNKIAADSGINVADLSALTYTIPDHTYAVGSHTVQATVRTPAGDTKTVPVTLTYTDVSPPTVTIPDTNIFVFSGESIKLLNPSAPTATTPVATKIQLATVTDATGVATSAVSNANNSVGADVNNARGLTLSVEGGSATSKTIYLNGSVATGTAPNSYGNYIRISDTANPANTTTYSTTTTNYNLNVLNTQVTQIPDRNIQSTTFTKVSNDEILNAVTVQFGNANQATANIRKLILSNTDTGTTPTLGQKTAVVRVYTASNTYKDVTVNFTYVDTTAPTATLTATSLYAFEGQALQARIQLATLVDAPNGSGLTGGQATSQIVIANSATENGKGLTINTSGQVSGTPTAGSQGVYTNRVLVRDNAGNTGYSNNFKMYVLRVNPVTETREYTGTNKFTQDEITNLIKNKIAADSGINVADLSALSYTIPDHTYAVGSHTIQATVRTPAGDTKMVPVTLNYTDTRNPTITSSRDVTVFAGKLVEMVGNTNLIPVTATDVSGVTYQLNNASFGVTVNPSTGQVEGTAVGNPGFYSRTVTVTDGQGRITTSPMFKIYVIQANSSTIEREYGQTISADEIKNAITLNRGTNGSSVAVNMELLDPIPQN